MHHNGNMHVINYSNRVRSLNQLKSPSLLLTAVEANNLLSDITNMLAEMASLQQALKQQAPQTQDIQLDGGSF